METTTDVITDKTMKAINIVIKIAMPRRRLSYNFNRMISGNIDPPSTLT
ncbi:MAG: hypothetical protein LUE09_07625 [Synergistaceae bacterium]|nr:hypothetical protein [Synergistaceae bacterium]